MNTLFFLNRSVHRPLTLFSKFADFWCCCLFLKYSEPNRNFIIDHLFEYNYNISHIALVVSVLYIFRTEFITFDYLKNVDEKNSFNKRGYPYQELNFFFWFISG